ncbi:MAG TPA: hypothetical protein VGO43_13950 [Pyrinomonadaceae bacterium]|jgi:uncharacterized protein YcfJ|nr:hypothetical protein [Pyrinomonadaceae bacterium]
MRKVFIAILVALVLGVSLPVLASSPVSNFAASVNSTTHQTRTRRRHKRSFWRKHRNKLTVAGAGVAGAAIGGLAGGRKGALIGAGAGAGGGALYTYKLRKRHHRRRRP